MKKKFACTGASLFTAGMFTGLWSAAALTGKVSVGIPHLALAAHLNALLGALWLIAVGVTLEHLGYDDRQLRRLYWLSVVPAWGNWGITLVASFLGVRGLEYTGDKANDAIAFLLQAVVVLPTLAAALYWARGFCKEGKTNG